MTASSFIRKANVSSKATIVVDLKEDLEALDKLPKPIKDWLLFEAPLNFSVEETFKIWQQWHVKGFSVNYFIMNLRINMLSKAAVPFNINHKAFRRKEVIS